VASIGSVNQETLRCSSAGTAKRVTHLGRQFPKLDVLDVPSPPDIDTLSYVLAGVGMSANESLVMKYFARGLPAYFLPITRAKSSTELRGR
jgi:hypothetical protein